MKVCAHINSGPFQHSNERFATVAEAISYFRKEIVRPCRSYGYFTDDNDGCYVMDLYPQCADCGPMENYHDYPMSRYSVGVRGGLRKESI